MRMSLKDLKKCTARIAPTSIPVVRELESALKTVRTKTTETPHDILWRAVQARWPGRAVREFEGAVPGRRFRIDVAFPHERLALELDGWAYHGRHLGDFTRDRERQNLLCLHGWRVLRFSAGMVRKDLDHQIGILAAALDPDKEGCPTALVQKRSITRRPQGRTRSLRLKKMR